MIAEPILDNKWPNELYPAYFSGGAYLVNKAALQAEVSICNSYSGYYGHLFYRFVDLNLKVLGKNMTKFPKISINDAFIGCVMFLSKSFKYNSLSHIIDIHY